MPEPAASTPPASRQPAAGQSVPGQPVDTRFSLPAVDDPATTEVGVILLGLDADRLLAGLGIAHATEDPAVVALLVDQARHGTGTVSLDTAVLAGARRWRSARTMMAVDEGVSASAAPRQAWAQTYRLLADEAETEPAAHSYLTACWLRRDEVDRRAAAVVVAGAGTAPGGPSGTRGPDDGGPSQT